MEKEPLDRMEGDQGEIIQKTIDPRSRRGGYLDFDHDFYPDAVILRVNGRNFTVSASYLGLSSPYFYDLFYGHNSSLYGRHELECDPHTFGDLLDLVYPCFKRTNCCGDCSSSLEARLNLALKLKLRPAVKRLIAENGDSQPRKIKIILQENSAFDCYCHLLPLKYAAPEPEVVALRDCSDGMEPLLVTDAFPDSTTVLVGGVSVVVSATSLSIHSLLLNKMLYENGAPVKGVKIDIDLNLFATIVKAMQGDFPTDHSIALLDNLLVLGANHLYAVFLANTKKEALRTGSQDLVPELLIHLANQPEPDIDCLKIFTNFTYGDFDAEILSKCDGLPASVKEMLSNYRRETERITVFVKTLRGTDITLDNVSQQCPVELFMKMVEIREGVPIHDQRLIWAGKQLEWNKTLADYNILHHSTIQCVTRLRGC